jgi:hypothetical protein
LFGVLILIFIVSGWAIYSLLISKEVSDKTRLIQEVSDNIYIFNFPFIGDDSYEAMVFDIPTERYIQLHTWATSISGNVSISMIG